MKNGDTEISLKEGYEIMLHMLNKYYELTGSTDLTDVLGGGEYLSDNQPVDTASWDYWLEARQTFREKGPLSQELK